MNTDETIKAAADRAEMKDLTSGMSPIGAALFMALKPADPAEQIRNLRGVTEKAIETLNEIQGVE